MKYTQQQEEFLKSNYKNIFINAVPGAGKTTMISEKIKILSKNDSKKVLYITFSLKLVNEIRQKLHIQGLHISTIHSLLTKFLRQYLKFNFIITEQKNLLNVNIKQLTFADIEDITLKNITHFRHWISNNYAYIFIDEVQDITPKVATIIQSLLIPNQSYSLYLLGDINQSIYQRKDTDIKMISKIKDSKLMNKIQFNHTFRLGRKTCKLIKLIFGIPINTKANVQEKINFINAENIYNINSQLASLLSIWLKDTTQLAENQLTKSERLLQVRIDTEVKNILILAKYNRALDRIYDSFQRKNLPVYKIGTLLKTEQEFINSYQQFLYQNLHEKSPTEAIRIPKNIKSLLNTTRLPRLIIEEFLNTNSIQHNLELLYTAKKYLQNTINESAINLSTIHKAKGLEVDATILIDFYKNNYNLSKEYDKNLLFVALTRHTKQLIVLSSKDSLTNLPKYQKIIKTINFINTLIPRIPQQQKLF